MPVNMSRLKIFGYSINILLSVAAVAISFLSLLVAAQSLRLTHIAEERRNERIRIEFGRPDFFLENGVRAHIAMDYRIIIFNASENAINIKSLRIDSSRTDHYSAPNISDNFPVAECEYDEEPTYTSRGPNLGPSAVTVIRIAPLDTYQIDIHCKVHGPKKVTDLINDFLEYASDGSVNNFIRHIYEKEQIDYAGMLLPENFQYGAATIVTESRLDSPEMGPLSYLQINIQLTTFNDNYFADRRFIYLGASRYR